MAESFDHQRSDRVDVFAKQNGEFVQVWNEPRGTPGRRLLMAYLRTPAGPREVIRWQYPEDGAFEQVQERVSCS